MNVSPLETVRSMYAAFGRGDVLAVLAPMHPDVDWRINVNADLPGARGIPIFRPFRGSTDVANFFALLASELEFHGFEPQGFVADEREVIARVQMEWTVRRTARRARAESLHRFVFNPAGQLVTFREYSDTHAIVAAWTP